MLNDPRVRADFIEDRIGKCAIGCAIVGSVLGNDTTGEQQREKHGDKRCDEAILRGSRDFQGDLIELVVWRLVAYDIVEARKSY